jgi:hypothetical protein
MDTSERSVHVKWAGLTRQVNSEGRGITNDFWRDKVSSLVGSLKLWHTPMQPAA